jgi:hypothetical protein
MEDAASITTEVGRTASISFSQSLSPQVWACDTAEIEGLTVTRTVVPAASGNFGAAADVKFEITASEPVTADLEFDLVDTISGQILETVPLKFEAC